MPQVLLQWEDDPCNALEPGEYDLEVIDIRPRDFQEGVERPELAWQVTFKVDGHPSARVYDLLWLRVNDKRWRLRKTFAFLEAVGVATEGTKLKTLRPSDFLGRRVRASVSVSVQRKEARYTAAGGRVVEFYEARFNRVKAYLKDSEGEDDW